MTKKIELTREQAEHILKCIADDEDDISLCKVCDFSAANGGQCPLFEENDLAVLHAAARVLYGTPQKLDRVEMAWELFKGSYCVLWNECTFDSSDADKAFTAADAFIAFAEEGGEE